VFVQADCVAQQGLAEVRYVERLDWPQLAGVVAFAPLEHGPAVEPLLAKLAEHPRVVGVRRLLQGEPVGFATGAGFGAGLAAAARRGLTFDATVRADQLTELVELAREVPEAVIILDHLGNPPLHHGLSSAPGRRWLAGIRALAAEPSVVVKLSGKPAVDRRGLPFVLAALEAFGARRAMLGSDHPLSVPADKQAYDRWVWSADAALDLNDDERAAVRHGTAIKTYRLKELPSSPAPHSVSTEG